MTAPICLCLRHGLLDENMKMMHAAAHGEQAAPLNKSDSQRNDLQTASFSNSAAWLRDSERNGSQSREGKGQKRGNHVLTSRP